MKPTSGEKACGFLAFRGLSAAPLGLKIHMSQLHIQNWKHELANDCAWTAESVEISCGDLYINGEPFGTYFAACYPDSARSPQFIVNVINASGQPVMSIPFECVQSLELARPIEAAHSPWSEDGVLIGPIPNEAERSAYTTAGQVLTVARQLVGLEPNLASHRSQVGRATALSLPDVSIHCGNREPIKGKRRVGRVE